jgi:universal stress protein E
VIAGSEEPWGVRDILLGNPEKEIVRDCPNDVLIVRYRPVAPSRRIVVAVDPDAMDRRRSLLAAETVEAAATFADWDNSELHVVNVIPSFKYYVLALNAGLSAVDANNVEAEARSEQQRTIYQFLERLHVDRDRMKVHLLQGDPVQKIANLVSHLDADLLAIGSAGRRGIGRLLIGNTAEEVRRQVSCSYLVVKNSKVPRGRAPNE